MYGAFGYPPAYLWYRFELTKETAVGSVNVEAPCVDMPLGEMEFINYLLPLCICGTREFSIREAVML